MCTGERIRKRRIAVGMSVNQLSELIGKDRATLYRYENGSIDDIPVSVVGKISEVLRISPTYLIGWDDDPKEEAPELPPDEAKLLEAYRNADPIYRDVALKILEDNPMKKGSEKTA